MRVISLPHLQQAYPKPYSKLCAALCSLTQHPACLSCHEKYHVGRSCASYPFSMGVYPPTHCQKQPCETPSRPFRRPRNPAPVFSPT